MLWHFWLIAIGIYMWVCFAASILLSLISAPSWEYITTLEYEFNVIRGRMTYRWTIWVCNNMQSF